MYLRSTNFAPGHVPIRINNFSALEVIGPNRIFVTNQTPEHPDQFALDLAHLQKTAIGFSYRLHIDPATSQAEPHVPLLINTAWKPQGDKLGLLLQYKPNPAFRYARSGSAVNLHNVVIFATYEGKASGVQTKPSGTHLKDKRLVYWRLGDVALRAGDDDAWQKIVCRVVGEQGAEPKPGHIEARWEFSPPSSTHSPALSSPWADADAPDDSSGAIGVSRLEEPKGKEKEIEQLSNDDPFADAAADETVDPAPRWVDVPTVRRLVSGKYHAV